MIRVTNESPELNLKSNNKMLTSVVREIDSFEDSPNHVQYLWYEKNEYSREL